MPIDFESNSWLGPPIERRWYGKLCQDVVRKIQKGKHKALLNRVKVKHGDEDGIRTHACRAQWISSPSP